MTIVGADVKFIKNISIKIKIIAGFGLMQLILAVIAISALVSLLGVGKEVTNITTEIQPAVLAGSELQSTLEHANSSMGLFLVSQEESFKEEYKASLQKAEEILTRLQEMPLVQSNAEIAAQVEAISDDVLRFMGYQETILFLADNPLDNIPATKFTNENLRPLSVLMMQLVNEMISLESQQPASDQRRKLLLDMEIIRNGWSNVRYGLQSYLSSRQVISLRDIKLARRDVEGGLTRLQENKAGLNAEQAAALEQFAALKASFFERLGEMIGIHGGEAWRTDAHLIRTELGPLLKQVGEKVTALVNTFNDQIVVTSDDLVSEVGATNALVTTMLVVGLLFGFIIGWAITRAIIAPLQATLSAMEDIVGGEGDLTRRLDDSSLDEIGRLAHGFNRFAEVVHQIVSEVMGYTNKLTGSAQRLSVVSEETSRGVEVQINKTDQVVTAVNEMTATGEEVARNTNAAADAAKNADEAACEGQKVVSNTIDAINNLAEEVQRAAQVINKLEQDSIAIGGVLDVIRGIAEQTNLLALNAAIEAARAGEQGRGFAVVADEVRTLASRTQDSTTEIQAMIERLQQGAQSAVEVMEQSKGRAGDSVNQAAQAGTSLQAISQAVNVIKQMNVQIATAAEEQNAVGAEINRAVVEISEITDQTAAGAQQTASATNELTELADQLCALVKQFKV